VAHRARKRFGQNFLVDQNIIDKIAGRFANSRQPLIEIGPGQGALTRELLKLGVPLTAVEIDRDLIPILQREFSQHSHFQLRQGDALTVDFTTLAGGAPVRLVGNLPYNVATPLLFRLLEVLDFVVDMHFMLQWEVVARLTAKSGDKAYGQLSVVVQNLCDTAVLLEVPPASFKPAPKVNSAVIHLQPRQQPLVGGPLQPLFNQLVKQSFAQRRKTLRNNLNGMLDEADIRAVDIDPGLRAEALSLEQFAVLTQKLAEKAGH